MNALFAERSCAGMGAAAGAAAFVCCAGIADGAAAIAANKMMMKKTGRFKRLEKKFGIASPFPRAAA